ncbi:hypothetical protein F5X68DRAFT_233950 [Plectosphaerella plurivora]|uniref:Fungal N-terminal domain-containing protein n=1 Tax=Plectosphaerella plurivora TaxID=936078 RepID=A0A9P8V5R3_9PEZI|nr:hypothetical protein F5X68DRAFT_233950 [Plectosphaerella plurivora]
MAASFSFGSVGDIIALCQIAVELGRALDDTRGSAKEYQDLQQDLFDFVNVIAAYQQYQSSPWMQGLGHVVQDVVEQCTAVLEGARDSWLRKYGKHLRPSGSGSWVKDTYKKVKWRWEKQHVDKFREDLRKHTQRLGLLVTLTSLKSARVDNETLLLRIKEVDREIQKRDAHVLEEIQAQNRALEQVKACVEVQTSRATGFFQSISKAIEDVRRIVEGNTRILIEMRHSAANANLAYSLDPTREQNIFIENALGDTNEIPWNLIHSWKGLTDLLAHQKLQRGKQVDRTAPFKSVVRRGMKIEMSMIFVVVSFTNCCPRCSTPAQVVEGARVQCQQKHCGMWFRRAEKAIVSVQIGSTDAVVSVVDEMHSPLGTSSMDVHAANLVEPSDFQRVSLVEEELEVEIAEQGSVQEHDTSPGAEVVPPGIHTPGQETLPTSPDELPQISSVSIPRSMFQETDDDGDISSVADAFRSLRARGKRFTIVAPSLSTVAEREFTGGSHEADPSPSTVPRVRTATYFLEQSRNVASSAPDSQLWHSQRSSTNA